MASIEERFEEAQSQVKSIPTTMTNDTLLDLYSLYKQATEGDVSGSRPGLLDVKGRAKFDAWAKQKGITKENAMEKYVALVQELSDGTAG